MKFPSLVKLPRNKQFKYRARYYDEAMEDLEERVSNIKGSMSEEEQFKDFPRRKIKFKAPANKKISNSIVLMRLIIIILLVGGGLGYLQFGLTPVLISITVLFLGYYADKKIRKSQR